MKRVIFEIVKACLLGMLFLCVGLYLGTMNERKEQEAGNKQYETVETIAVEKMEKNGHKIEPIDVMPEPEKKSRNRGEAR